MKINALSNRLAVVTSALLLVPILFAALLVYVVFGSAGTFFYIVLFLAWVIGAVRGFRAISRTSVTVDANTVAWQTWKRPNAMAYATPTGSVPMPAVARFTIVTRERMIGKINQRGHIPVLTLFDGQEITLPMWSGASRTTPQLRAVVAAFRAVCPPQVIVDVRAIETAPMGVPQP